MKTSELTGAALDWAVAKCEGASADTLESFVDGMRCADDDNYSTSWELGGPLIEREDISILRCFGCWRAEKENYDHDTEWVGQGPTPLIAAMRCFCVSKLGETVEVPEELCK